MEHKQFKLPYANFHKNSMLCGSLSPRHGTSSGCEWSGRPTDTEGVCKCME